MVTNLLKCHAGEVEVIYLENVSIVFLLEGLEHPKAHVVLVGPPREVPITLDATKPTTCGRICDHSCKLALIKWRSTVSQKCCWMIVANSDSARVQAHAMFEVRRLCWSWAQHNLRRAINLL